MMMMVSAGDLIALYLGLELQSLALYVVAAIRRDDVRSSEAGLKYFVLGALSSGMLLYGASLIYGFTGSTSFEVIASVAGGAGGASIGLIVGLVFLMVGLAFKVSAVPFHMWTPDVYEGAPTPVTAFFAAAPKMAAMALLVRVMMTAFPGIASDQWKQIIVFLSIASMVLGAVAAIGQTNIKRLMAYSSIGHVGFALVGLAAGNDEGVQGVLIYMAIYLAMTLGTFACILTMRRKGGYVEDIEELGGLAKTNLGVAFVMAMLMFSLAGIPPLAGFWAKWYVFLAAVKAGLWPLAIIGVIASVVGCYYYLRIVKVMFFDDARKASSRCRARSASSWRSRGCSCCSTWSIRRRSWMPRPWPPRRCGKRVSEPKRPAVRCLKVRGSSQLAEMRLHQCGGDALRAERAALPLWVIATRQTAGKGRAGRAWVSDAGNLHASLS